MPLLQALDVSVRFGGVVAVDDVSLSAEEGRITGLIGPNGAGKTTLFNVITGLQPPTSGRVLFDGHDMTSSPVHTRARRGVARTFQRLETFGSLSVRENVLVAAEAHRRHSRRRYDAAELTDLILETVGLTTVAHRPASTLSTGLARLTELARALAIRPRLLLLDEPGSGLDTHESEAFGRILRDVAADGCGILLVEHDMDLIMDVCSWIHVLDFGLHICEGSPDTVKADVEVQKAYLGIDDHQPSAERIADITRELDR
jgi:branched-chain amino acid transport system ATP-binding protein